MYYYHRLLSCSFAHHGRKQNVSLLAESVLFLTAETTTEPETLASRVTTAVVLLKAVYFL